jgi:thioredoxin 1
VNNRSTIALGCGIAAWALGCADSGPSRPRRADEWVAATSDSTFTRDVLAAPTPSAVYFWAHGCLPCVTFGPQVKQVAGDYRGRIVFWKLNMGWSATRTRRYRVAAVPTLVVYRDGREVARQVGVPDGPVRPALRAFLDSALAVVPNVNPAESASP